MIRVLARYQVLPGQIEKVLQLLTDVAAKTRLEPGNLCYDVYQRLPTGNFILLDEEYKDQAALEAHRASAHFKELVQGKIIPLLASRTVDVHEVNP